MPGAYQGHTAQFLWIFGAATTALLALPMIVAPLGWGRMMRFAIPPDTDLALAVPFPLLPPTGAAA